MPAAIAIPMLIGSAVSGAAALGAAKIQSSAASKAQKAQQTATDRALAIQQEQSAPYRQLGQQGVNQLTALGAPQPYTQQFRAPGGGPQNTGFQPFQPSQPSGAPQGPSPTLGSIGMGGAPQGPQGQPQPQMATVQAPTGEMAQIPVGPQLDQALAKGARRMA